MNALQYTFNNMIRMEIPIEILELAFPQKRGAAPLSIEERMLIECIRPIIMTDMNALGGELAYLSVGQCNLVAVSDYSYNEQLGSFIIDVPKTITNNKSIVSVLSLVLGDYNGNGVSGDAMMQQCVSPVVADGMRLLGTMQPANIVQTARLELVGENKVLVEAYPPFITYGILKVNLANNANLENIQPGYYTQVSKLITLGVKRYVYNKLRIQLDIGHIYAGHEIPSFKEIVDSYSDAGELYAEQLKVWGKVSVLNDSRKMSQYTSTMIGMLG